MIAKQIKSQNNFQIIRKCLPSTNQYFANIPGASFYC